jgi:acetyl esterase/lipase
MALQDVIPATGLCLYKPSPLWPPPSNDISDKVHNGLRKSITDIIYPRSKGTSSRVPPAVPPMGPDNVVPEALPTEQAPMNIGATASLPLPAVPDADRKALFQIAEGRTVEVAQQVQLYAPNDLLRHPLVSPALSYLGGLPPLLFIAGDREVLRDEIIYT